MKQNKLLNEVFEPRLTLKEFSEFVGIPVSNVYYLIGTEKIPFFVSCKTKYISLIDAVKYRNENDLKKKLKINLTR